MVSFFTGFFYFGTYEEWYNKHVSKSNKSGILELADIPIGKNLGAAAFRDEIKLPNGQLAKITEGTKITKVVVFAGKGTKRKINVAKYLSKQYNIPESEWKKVRGEGLVDYHGVSRRAELHWFEAKGIDRIKMKVKRWLD